MYSNGMEGNRDRKGLGTELVLNSQRDLKSE